MVTNKEEVPEGTPLVFKGFMQNIPPESLDYPRYVDMQPLNIGKNQTYRVPEGKKFYITSITLIAYKLVAAPVGTNAIIYKFLKGAEGGPELARLTFATTEAAGSTKQTINDYTSSPIEVLEGEGVDTPNDDTDKSVDVSVTGLLVPDYIRAVELPR